MNKRSNRAYWQITLVSSRLVMNSLGPSKRMVTLFRAQWECCTFLWSVQRTWTEWITLTWSATKETSTVRQDQQRDSAQLTAIQSSALRLMTTRHPLLCKSLISTAVWLFSRLKSASMISRRRSFPRTMTFGSMRVRVTIHPPNFASKSPTSRTRSLSGMPKSICSPLRSRTMLASCSRFASLLSSCAHHSASWRGRSSRLLKIFASKIAWMMQMRRRATTLTSRRRRRWSSSSTTTPTRSPSSTRLRPSHG